MSAVFITGSADGLGQMAARRLVDEGHQVVLHARSPQRAREAADAVPGAAGALVADLSSIAETRGLAAAANERERFDAVIHNAGIGYRESRRIGCAARRVRTADRRGLSRRVTGIFPPRQREPPDSRL